MSSEQSSRRAVPIHSASSWARHQPAHRVARVRQQQRAQPAAQDLALEVRGRELVGPLAAQQDRDRGDQAEDLQQLLVGRVVGQEVAQVDVAQRGHGARQAGPAAAADGHVLGAVPRRQAAPVEPVVERRHRLAQLPDPGHRRIVVVGRIDRQALASRRRLRQRSGLRLALAEVGPARIAGAVAAGMRPGGDVDDAGPGHRPEGLWPPREVAGTSSSVGHRRTIGCLTGHPAAGASRRRREGAA